MGPRRTAGCPWSPGGGNGPRKWMLIQNKLQRETGKTCSLAALQLVQTDRCCCLRVLDEAALRQTRLSSCCPAWHSHKDFPVWSQLAKGPLPLEHLLMEIEPSKRKTGAQVQANGKNWTYIPLPKFKNMMFEICVEIQSSFFCCFYFDFPRDSRNQLFWWIFSLKIVKLESNRNFSLYFGLRSDALILRIMIGFYFYI